MSFLKPNIDIIYSRVIFRNMKMNKNEFGYPTNKPCVVCGKVKNNQIEPRFNYVVCEDHQHIPPNEIASKIK